MVPAGRLNHAHPLPTQDLKPVIDGMDGIKISQGLGLQDFDLIRVIGRGSYAKVLLVRLKKNDQVYAMKVVKKELVHDDEVSPAPRFWPLPLHSCHTHHIAVLTQWTQLWRLVHLPCAAITWIQHQDLSTPRKETLHPQ